MIARVRRHPVRKVRYAVVGLGHIAQAAVLPAFAHARANSELRALVSDDPVKRRALSRRYRVPLACSYEEFDELLAQDEIDAVFIGLPNPMHHAFAVRAAEAGAHVLCEKPMAMTEQECGEMMRAARDGGVKLMIGYRLHFEAANLSTIEAVRKGKIGDPRIFSSTFSMQVAPGNIRVRADGGGPLYDIGIYCVNAARYVFRDEPVEVTAFGARGGDRRFRDVDEAVSAVLRFPGGRLATFVCSFGASEVNDFRLVGTKGDVRLEPAFDYSIPLRQTVTTDGRSKTRTFAKRDQFAAELIYFSDGILHDREPEPSGREGLADVTILRAIQKSIDSGKPVRFAPEVPTKRPTLRQEIHRPPVRKPRPVRAPSPHPKGEEA